MRHAIDLILLYGGKSSEHEISLQSAASVLQNLDRDKYNVIPIAIDKNGEFLVNSYQELLHHQKKLPIHTPQSKRLPSLIENGNLALKADVVFPMLHGPLYEDGCIQGLLKLANAAYIGCDPIASAMGMDKDIARRIACVNGSQCARYFSLGIRSSQAERQQFCAQVINDLKWPLFVKPCSLGSSVGIHKATTRSELETAIADAFRYDEEILVEEFIVAREIELAVVESDNAKEPLVSLPGEIKVLQQGNFYSYAAKYLDSHSTELIAPVDLPQAVVLKLQKNAAEIFTRLKCRGMVRIDFFVNPTSFAIYFNEINTLPGFTSISMFPRLWEVSGLSYSKLLDKLVNSALHHQKIRQNIITSYR